ncbi:hypothetical protein LZD49_17330 [Dyadobacter sp. CY261]|uniref:relaxase/mobilization nuclease domain-containing protein n=1 Tax=Dyadobacter sp. CY261 TaxID=2907203 RepID=UPI001F3906FB|nr:hypothetical protein [Dyadobacter sp. CY261]MCF0072246.1 hypothetical protein [Dyadobacter sp. CY261]
MEAKRGRTTCRKLSEFLRLLIFSRPVTEIERNGSQDQMIGELSDQPHVHIVTTNVKADGSRISLHNLGKNQSEKTRKEIEIDFGLVKAQDRKAQEFNLKPVSITAAYGKLGTKKAIANVLDKDGSGNTLRGISYQPGSELCAWTVPSGASSCITDFDCGRMYGGATYLGRDAAG